MEGEEDSSLERREDSVAEDITVSERERERESEKRGLRVRERKGFGKIENEKETVGFVCVFKGRE